MKKIISIAVFGICLFAYSAGYSQDSTKTKEKGAKVMKKESKGKTKKAAKKTYKMDKKATKDK